ncbi:hypothetical protein GCM10010313_26490 [Streptomyces violarus]|nr:hypothetical protein GCM10010313_26490 [Streptomyces violarus]
MAGKREENPAGSSNNLRGDALRVLGVLKVATVEQIQQISGLHMSYRHTAKTKPSKRKQARTASHLGALSDLRKHGLAENGGQIPGRDTLRNLTPMGPKAASYELGRPVGEMGNPARGTGRTGASHPMVVNGRRTLLRPKPDLTQLANEPADVLAAAQAAVDAPDGLGTIASYATEVALPATGTSLPAPRPPAQPDARGARVRHLRHPVHRRTVEGHRARRVGQSKGDPPAPVRRLQAARHHRRTPSRAGRARAPGARPGRARAEGRRHLALPLPRMTSERRPRPGRTVLAGRGGYSQGLGSACHRALS